jgi:hypothetical protein
MTPPSGANSGWHTHSRKHPGGSGLSWARVRLHLGPRATALMGRDPAGSRRSDEHAGAVQDSRNARGARPRGRPPPGRANGPAAPGHPHLEAVADHRSGRGQTPKPGASHPRLTGRGPVQGSAAEGRGAPPHWLVTDAGRRLRVSWAVPSHRHLRQHSSGSTTRQASTGRSGSRSWPTTTRPSSSSWQIVRSGQAKVASGTSRSS